MTPAGEFMTTLSRKKWNAPIDDRKDPDWDWFKKEFNRVVIAGYLTGRARLMQSPVASQ
jgi:hypothetical protein